MAAGEVREFTVQARSTDTFGRVLCSSRDQHFVVDGPAQNGCPGEAITPGEIFLAGVASCGVELLQVVARAEKLPLRGVEVSVRGAYDPSRPVRSDLNVFNSVRLEFALAGVDSEQAAELVAAFKRR